MKRDGKIWFTEKDETKLARKKLIAELRSIQQSKAPMRDKMQETRALIEEYFKMDSHEEFLNANLPFN